MAYKTVLFDLDGTLLNTLTDLTNAVNHVLQSHGYPLRQEWEIRRFLGSGARHLLCQSLPEGVEEETLTSLLAEYQAWYSDHSQIETAPYEGIPSLISELEALGVSMAVVSNKGDRQVKDLVRTYFPQISVAVGERDRIRRKPYPDSVYEAMNELGATPETTLFLGDSEVDLQTAQNAGIDGAAVGWGFRDREELLPYHPRFFLDHPSDLLKGWNR